MSHFLIWLLPVFFLNPSVEHDIHVSVCDVNYEDGTFEIVLKTFLDDLQVAIGLEPGQELPEDYTSSDEMIYNYIVEKIKFSVDDQEYGFILDNISASMEAAWITLKIDKYSSGIPDFIHIQSTFLTEVYSDQMNLINFRVNETTKSISLNHKKVLATYKNE